MGVIVDHHCLGVVVRLVNMGVIVDHHCLEVVVRLVNMGVIVDHHCVEVVVGLANNHLNTVMVNNYTHINQANNNL
jgi:hypothetical protein